MDFSALLDITNYIYYELTLGIIVVTMVINKLFNMKAWVHSKWTSLAVAAFGGLVHYLTHVDSDVWKIVISFSVSVLAYDYIVKVIQDKIRGKNPLV